MVAAWLWWAGGAVAVALATLVIVRGVRRRRARNEAERERRRAHDVIARRIASGFDDAPPDTPDPLAEL